MKINSIPCVLAAAIATLIAFGLYSIHAYNNAWLVAIGGFICLALPLATTFGVSFEQSRTTTNIKVLSGTFFALLLVSHFVFAFLNFTTPAYIVINGIVLLLWLLIAYAITKAKM